jgi:membrane fusion protein (multidrug efflux system)
MLLNTLQRYTMLSLLLVAAACGKKNQQGQQGPPAVNVVVKPSTTTDAIYYEEYPAVVRALNETELRAQVNGYITAIHFTEGSKVHKGQKLYSIDQQQYEATYEQAQANLKVQEANLEKAQKDVERYRELNKSDAIAKQQVDYAEATYAAAQRQVDAAKAAMRGVQTNVRYSTINAPFDGTIGISNVRLGAAVSAGQTLLNTISSDDPIAADIAVDQREILRFTQLFARKGVKGDSTFRLAVGTDLYPEPGHISVIDRAVDPQTGSIKMRLVFPNHDHLLRSGMSATLRVLASSAKSIIIPYKAVTEQLGEFYVYVLADSNKVTQRKVVLGTQVGKDIVIKSGLSENESVVVEGVQNLREGSVVNTAPPAAPATAKTK